MFKDYQFIANAYHQRRLKGREMSQQHFFTVFVNLQSQKTKSIKSNKGLTQSTKNRRKGSKSVEFNMTCL